MVYPLCDARHAPSQCCSHPDTKPRALRMARTMGLYPPLDLTSGLLCSDLPDVGALD
jgi:hypothetical protein